MTAIHRQSSNRESANSNESQNGRFATEHQVQQAAGYSPEQRTLPSLNKIVREKVFCEAAAKRLNEQAPKILSKSPPPKNIAEQKRLQAIERTVEEQVREYQNRAQQMTNALRLRNHF